MTATQEMGEANQPFWEIRVYSAGGGEDQPEKSFNEALEEADADLRAREAGLKTGDEWLDKHNPASRALVVKAANDGGYEDLGKVDPELINREEQALNAMFSGASVVTPPTPYAFFSYMIRNSGSLRQNVEAYCRAIDGHGFQLNPVIDLTSDGVESEIGAAVYMERLHQQRFLTWQGREQEAAAVNLDVTPEEIEARKQVVKKEMAAEKARLQLFFENCNPRETLVRLRRKLRKDLETYGMGYLALRRNAWGEPLYLYWIPTKTTRPVRQTVEDKNVKVQDRAKISPISYDTFNVTRSFRRYVQGIGDDVTISTGTTADLLYFKEIGDPRVIGDRTGTTYPDKKALEKAIKKKIETGEAMEVIPFSLLDTEHSAYSMPRWQGQAVGAMGEIEAEQSNLQLLRNEAIPDMMILCEGGRFAGDAVKKIEHHLKTRLKGKNRSRSILTLEAAPAGPGKGSGVAGEAPVPKIHVIPLTQFQRDDAMYVTYMARQSDRLDSAFGNPPIAVGKYKNMNRNTATVLADHVEKHIYQPERQDFDDMINLRLLPLFEARYWKFRSNAPVNRDSRELVELAEIAVEAGILTVDEARLVVGDALSTALPPFLTDWSKTSLPVYLAELKLETAAAQVNPGGGQAGEGADDSRGKLVKCLEKRGEGRGLSKSQALELLGDLRSELMDKLEQTTLMGMDDAKLRDIVGRVQKGDGERIEVDVATFKEWVSPEPMKSSRNLGSMR